jgi:hypothetical protein
MGEADGMDSDIDDEDISGATSSMGSVQSSQSNTGSEPFGS